MDFVVAVKGCLSFCLSALSIYTLHWICSSESMRASSWCSTVSSSVLIKGYRLLRETFLSFDLAFVYKCRVVRWCAWVVGIAMGILLHGNRVAMVLIKSINVPVMSAVHIWNYTHKLYTYGFNYIIDSDVFLMWKIQRNCEIRNSVVSDIKAIRCQINCCQTLPLVLYYTCTERCNVYFFLFFWRM